MSLILLALLSCGFLVGCNIDQPRPDAVDAQLSLLRPPQSLDSARRHWQDSIQVLMRDRRLRSGPVEPEGPALIAVYPFLEPGTEALDPELASLVRDFRTGLAAARQLAHAAGLEYWERYGPSITLADRRGQMLSSPSVGRDGVGYVIVVFRRARSLVIGQTQFSRGIWRYIWSRSVQCKLHPREVPKTGAA
jgi:hypothetical protein